VKSIRIYSELETLGALVGSYNIGGIIEIDLIDPLYEIAEELQVASLKIEGLQIPLSYPITGELKPDIPRIQTLVYWDPEARVNPDENFQFSFPSPDLHGTYSLDMLIQEANGKIYPKSFLLNFDKAGWQTIEE